MFSETIEISSKWVPGSDGRMHQEVFQTRTDMVRNNHGEEGTQQQVICVDGKCEERHRAVEVDELREVEELREQASRPSPLRIEFLVPQRQVKEIVALPAERLDASLGDAWVLGAVAAAVSTIAVAAVCKCLGTGVSAREAPLRALGLPLLDEEMPMSNIGTAAADKAVTGSDECAQAVAEYLPQMYVRAAAQANTVATRAYLARMYVNALA